MEATFRPTYQEKAGIRRRVLASSCYPAFFRGHQRVGTPEYLSMMRLRKIWAEGSFSVLKREHCISKIRKRGILAATEECLLAAMALNLKRMAKCHLSLSPNLLFCWNHCGFQQFFCFCQQVPYCTLSKRRNPLNHRIKWHFLPTEVPEEPNLYAFKQKPLPDIEKRFLLHGINIGR